MSTISLQLLLTVAAIVAAISTGFVDGSCAAVTDRENSTCQNGQCKLICKPGYADCNGKIEDGCEVHYAGEDVENCGGCGRKCASPKPFEFVSCDGGKCKYADRCVAKCVTYPNADTTCSNNKCRVKCHPGFGNCDGVLEAGANGCEVNFLTDAHNCGACGFKCPTPRRCGAGAAKCRNGVCG